MSSVVQMVRCNGRKKDEEDFRECSGEGSLGSKEAVQRDVSWKYSSRSGYAACTNFPAAVEPVVPILEDSQGKQRDESKVRLWREVSQEDPWSERVHANVKGKEDAGHECSFYCRCWTD
ncbi:hypothetical protein CXK86_17220 [Paenibacillus sp. BGI2013]|uniref:hypothetical protein n=1 Tax=Paenibacillus sp. BGI2013 TaxID=2058902 RepID=UPI000C6D91CA|nr:hypothetical protein [Paenibacillus sp. BGI2013]PKQ90038.1 hypothetical protein CXK86_17220 [Paenibacillus sp. BGI2013]